MKKITLILLVCCLPLVSFGQSLLRDPQKVIIDKKAGRVGYTRNRLLVSNFGNGSIVEIDTAGNQSIFISGAGFVDGLEIVGENVYGVGNNRMVLWVITLIQKGKL